MPDLTFDEIIRLEQLADVLLPRHGYMPSASEVAICEQLSLTAFIARPDLIELVREAISRCADRDSNDAIRYLATEFPELLSGLTQAVAGTYFMNPRVKLLLGYDGQKQI